MDYMDFRKKLATDSAFRARFADCKTLEALIEAASREGYGFTADEVRNNTDLLPEEVAFVAGGMRRPAELSANTQFTVSPKIMGI